MNATRSLVVPLLFCATAAPCEIVVHENPRHLTCSVEAAHWDSRTLDALAPGNRISGRIRLVEGAPHPTYPPAAGFLYAVPRTNGTTAGAQIGHFESGSDSMIVGLRVPRKKQLIPFARVPRGQWVPLSVALDERGGLEVSVAGVTTRRRIRPSPGLVPFLMCNSGTWEFELDEGMQPSSQRFPHPRS